MSRLRMAVALSLFGLAGFGALPAIGEIPLPEWLLKSAWDDLHNAVGEWDLTTTQAALNTLKTSWNPCTREFAREFQAELIRQGKEGFREINPIKQAHNAHGNCQLPLVDYEFSPLTTSPEQRVERAWDALHTVAAVWDVESALRVLDDLGQGAQQNTQKDPQCVQDFVFRLKESLMRSQEKGFHDITPIKEDINAAKGCDLPIVFFEFSPPGGRIGSGKEPPWDLLHRAAAVWDVPTAQIALTELDRSAAQAPPQERMCTQEFTQRLRANLNLSGPEGFRTLNILKQDLKGSRGCDFPMAPFAFSASAEIEKAPSPNPTLGAWNALHNAVAVWDVTGSYDALRVLETTGDRCTSVFAGAFKAELEATGTSGFSAINIVKQRINNNIGCALPLVAYRFAPIL